MGTAPDQKNDRNGGIGRRRFSGLDSRLPCRRSFERIQADNLECVRKPSSAHTNSFTKAAEHLADTEGRTMERSGSAIPPTIREMRTHAAIVTENSRAHPANGSEVFRVVRY